VAGRRNGWGSGQHDEIGDLSRDDRDTFTLLSVVVELDAVFVLMRAAAALPQHAALQHAVQVRVDASHRLLISDASFAERREWRGHTLRSPT
jgi:hypothetical protein